MKRGSTSARWAVQVKGAGSLQRALRFLQEPDAPYLRAALERSGRLLSAAAARRAPGSIGRSVSFVGVRELRGTLRALIIVQHPGAASMEFGRVYYYRGYKGRAVRATGQRFRVPPGRGQKARPYLGVIEGNAAIGEVRDEVERLLANAIEAEWDRIAAAGYGGED